MQKILKASGSDLEHVVKVNAYLTNMQRDFAPMNEVYLEVRSLSIRSSSISENVIHSFSDLLPPPELALAWRLCQWGLT